MKYTIDAACFCHMGKIRKNNEDNFFFNGSCLEMKNTGLKAPVKMQAALRSGLCFAVFDGMGGENFGENASFAAARTVQASSRRILEYFVSERKYLSRLCEEMNDAVVAEARELLTEHMGTTVVTLYFGRQYVYVCNIGDSRAYRLRDGEFLQLSEDHVEKPRDANGQAKKKTPLTQHLGIDPDLYQLEPYIAKGELQSGDWYLLCSDGLTDMLSNFEISDIMLNSRDSIGCVSELGKAALEHGGKDNITVIVCRIR